jgi:hypothetical protein
MRARKSWRSYSLTAALVLAGACRDDRPHKNVQCTPGAQRSCSCPLPFLHHAPIRPRTLTRTQVCAEDGFWNACDCPPDPPDPETEETGGRGGSGTGGKSAFGGTGGAGGVGDAGSRKADAGETDGPPADTSQDTDTSGDLVRVDG